MMKFEFVVVDYIVTALKLSFIYNWAVMEEFYFKWKYTKNAQVGKMNDCQIYQQQT
jgi:hypothetical protein